MSLKVIRRLRKKPIMTTNTYICAMCGGEFDKGRTDEEAIIEMKSFFRDVPKEEIDVICDDCFNKIHPSKFPLTIKITKNHLKLHSLVRERKCKKWIKKIGGFFSALGAGIWVGIFGQTEGYENIVTIDKFEGPDEKQGCNHANQ